MSEIDPRIRTAFENATAALRDSNGNPPSRERVDQMWYKFLKFKSNGSPDDLAYIEAIGDSWKC